MSDEQKKIGFYIKELNVGEYSVRCDLVDLLLNGSIIRHFHHWLLTRNRNDKIYLYLENGATPNIWSGGMKLIVNLSNVIKAIQLSPSYENINIIVPQMVTGVGSYLVLTTPRIFWGPLGCVCFDGWLSGKDISEYDQAMRADIEWVKSYFKKGVGLKLFTENEVRDFEEGRMVTVGLDRKLKHL